MPSTRSKTSTEFIVVHGSDSELDSPKGSKRQKTGSGSQPDDFILVDDDDDDSGMDVDSEIVYVANQNSRPHINHITVEAPKALMPERNTHLKGRKRFAADLVDMKEECEDGFNMQGLKVTKLRAGDDEGTLEFSVANSIMEHVVSVNLLISDTSDYPKSHSFFGFSPDVNLAPHLFEIVESVSAMPSRTIRDTIVKLIAMLVQTVVNGAFEQVESQEIEMEDEEGSGDDYDPFDEFDDFPTGKSSRMNKERLQSDFIEIVATNYRPGLLRFGGDDFAISVSLPVLTLAESIPPRALMAWDKCLLSRTQHLTLLILGFRSTYPVVDSDGTFTQAAHRSGATLSFKVGLTQKYKPGVEHAQEASRTFGLIVNDAEDELRLQAEKAAFHDFDTDPLAEDAPDVAQAIVEEEEDEGRFDRFSLSNSLESLLDQGFLKVVQLRRKFALGWAGAEVLLSEVEASQMKAEDVFNQKRAQIIEADKAEAKLSRTNTLPHDPLVGLGKGEDINIPLTAFCYLVRRLTLCTRYCIVCHNKLTTDYEALKPYVCDSKLCSYQYYSLNRGPSLEYEIMHNPETVDLLLSITYVAAAEQALDEPFPIGMALRVPLPDTSKLVKAANMYGMAQPPSTVSAAVVPPTIGKDGLCDFDTLDITQMRASIAQLIDSLPAIDEMKKHLGRKVKAGKSKPRLKDLDPAVLPAAWSILRWCVASCTAYLEEISSGEECIKNMDVGWRQFRFSVGAPDAESKFRTAVVESQAKNKNATKYPSLYAFHGSPLRNWHSIIRHGLWFKSVAHGRSFGNGVYLAKDGSISMSGYAQAGSTSWRKSKIAPANCIALAELVNLPGDFVSQNPYFVIQNTHWIMCRYLLVKGGEVPIEDGTATNAAKDKEKKVKNKQAPFVKLDPVHPTLLNNKQIEIPEPSYQLEMLLQARKHEYFDEANDEEDLSVFEYKAPPEEVIEVDDDDEYAAPSQQSVVVDTGKGKAKARPANDWTHDPEWVNNSIANLMPPPLEASPSATMAVQRELRTMLKEQELANSYKELGWYMPPELIGDNLFQWIVEMHSFDSAIPIAKDMKAKKLNSLIFEIRFPPSFPLAPPFFRIVTPRFLPFIHGGGGHVTGGGSICMDLLTSDGWLPSYSIAAVLMQIKLAISNLDPRPARLSADWNRPYHVSEALEGYKRAAATHGWQVPVGLEKLVR